MSTTKYGPVEPDPNDPPFNEEEWIVECKNDDEEYLEQNRKLWRRYLENGLIDAKEFHRLETEMRAMLARPYQSRG